MTPLQKVDAANPARSAVAEAGKDFGANLHEGPRRQRQHMTADSMARALGGGPSGGGWHRCRCPVHNSRGPTLALKDLATGLVVNCHAGCRRADILAELPV